MDEEFGAKLERDRQAEESKALQNRVQTLFELQSAKDAELKKLQREQQLMTIEDVCLFGAHLCCVILPSLSNMLYNIISLINLHALNLVQMLSALPPLSKPDKVTVDTYCTVRHLFVQLLIGYIRCDLSRPTKTPFG